MSKALPPQYTTPADGRSTFLVGSGGALTGMKDASPPGKLLPSAFYPELPLLLQRVAPSNYKEKWLTDIEFLPGGT